jgi:hypothetical protein
MQLMLLMSSRPLIFNFVRHIVLVLPHNSLEDLIDDPSIESLEHGQDRK